MCANYAPTRADLLEALTSLEIAFSILPEVYPGQAAPLIRVTNDGELQCVNSSFGLIPSWSKDPKFSRHTYNARSETAANKPSYRHAWAKRHIGLAPMQSFYEPNYESGKPVRWRIERYDEQPFFAAALWEWRPGPTEQGLVSHTLLTVNADGHNLMQRFHAPQDEKRSVVTFDWVAGIHWLTDLHAPLIETLTTIDTRAYKATEASKKPLNLPTQIGLLDDEIKG